MVPQADPTLRVFCPPVCSQRGLPQSDRLGLRNGIQWIDIEVENDAMGKPFFMVYRKAREVLEVLRVQTSLLTLSHEPPYAVAHVILEGRDHESRDR